LARAARSYHEVNTHNPRSSNTEAQRILPARCAEARASQQQVESFAVTNSDTDDLPVYGKLAVFNADANNAEVIRVVPVGSQDDTA